MLPDLFIDPYLTRVAGGSVFARVQNVGNWPSGATVLEVWNSPPGTAGAVKLASIAVPPLAAGAHADLNGAVEAAAVETAAVDATSAAYLLLDPANAVLGTAARKLNCVRGSRRRCQRMSVRFGH